MGLFSWWERFSRNEWSLRSLPNQTSFTETVRLPSEEASLCHWTMIVIQLFVLQPWAACLQTFNFHRYCLDQVPRWWLCSKHWFLCAACNKKSCREWFIVKTCEVRFWIWCLRKGAGRRKECELLLRDLTHLKIITLNIRRGCSVITVRFRGRARRCSDVVVWQGNRRKRQWSRQKYTLMKSC